MIDARFAVANIGNHLPNWSELAPRFYKRRGDNAYVHVCYPALAYERLTSLPPRPVDGVINEVCENNDGRLACRQCGAEVPKAIEMAIRLKGMSI